MLYKKKSSFNRQSPAIHGKKKTNVEEKQHYSTAVISSLIVWTKGHQPLSDCPKEGLNGSKKYSDTSRE